MAHRRPSSVSFLFRIKELRENPLMTPEQDANGQWAPSDAPGANFISEQEGATNIWWLCDGNQIRALSPNDNNLLQRATLYKTYSTFYCHGKGFLVLRDNAINSTGGECWFPLSFEHDKHDYSSYLTNARYEPILHCHQKDKKWVKMLLPDVNHDRWEVPPPHGGLKGELGIFLALIAFAIPANSLQQYLPSMFHTGAWQQYDMANGRDHKRGVIVEVYKYSSRHGGSSKEELEHYEEHGMYYT